MEFESGLVYDCERQSQSGQLRCKSHAVCKLMGCSEENKEFITAQVSLSGTQTCMNTTADTHHSLGGQHDNIRVCKDMPCNKERLHLE